VAGSCEHGDEPSGSIECGKFLDWLSILVASQGVLCSMELVSTLCSFSEICTSIHSFIQSHFMLPFLL
jgi:hypothetical protein